MREIAYTHRMARRLLLTSALAALLIAAGAACVEPRSTLPLIFQELSNDVVTELGRDSVTEAYWVGSEIMASGVFYGDVSCDGLTWDGTGGVGGRNFMRVEILAEDGAACPRQPRRVTYHLTLSSLDPQIYTLEILHDEPGTLRGPRTVFSGQFDLRGPP